MANDPQMLRDAIEKSGQIQEYRLETYADIKEHYRQEYGDKSWKSAYAREVASIEGKSYGAVLRSIQRYEGGYTSTSKYVGETQVSKVSEKIGPVSREVNMPIALHMQGKQGDIRGGVKTSGDRTTDVIISPETANKIISGKGGWSDVWGDYGVEEDIFEDGDYEYAVSSVSAT